LKKKNIKKKKPNQTKPTTKPNQTKPKKNIKTTKPSFYTYYHVLTQLKLT